MRHRYATRNIDKEMIFYYVYGLLHSEEYRKEFEADLMKSLPRIPIVEKLDDFLAFSKAGKKLADLHLNYETVAPHPAVIVYDANDAEITEDGVPMPKDNDYFRYYVGKMRFAKMDGVDKTGKPKKVDDKSIIIYNENIRIENIPAKAYQYVVNGKSAIEWIMERYAISVDTKSGIKNDPNDWSREHGKPRYILDLLLSVINVSCQTVDIVMGLPHLDCCKGVEEDTDENVTDVEIAAKVEKLLQSANVVVNGDLHLHGDASIGNYYEK